MNTAWFSNYYWKEIVRPIAQKVRSKLESMTEIELMEIVKAREMAPWYERLFKDFFNGIYFEENLKYRTARDLLAGKLSWEGIDRANEEDRIERVREHWQYKRKQVIIRRGERVKLFAGSLEELERLTGQKYKIVNDGKIMEYWFPRERRELGEMKVDALIRYDAQGFGIPVRRKRIKRSESRHI